MTQKNDAISTALTPTEFCRRHHINRYNVYYWMREHGLGFKEGKFWYLPKEDQDRLLKLYEDQSNGRKFAKTVKKNSDRKHAAQSVESIMANLRVDEEVAEMIHLAMGKNFLDTYLPMMLHITDLKDEVKSLFDHDKVLVLVNRILGEKGVGQLAVNDGFPQYKFVIREDPEEFTVVYSIREQTFYLDNVEQMRKVFSDLNYEENNLS